MAAPNSPSPQLISASQLTLDELTDIYNQTRADYLIPMPMVPAELAAYLRLYSVDLQSSFVAVDGSNVLGLGMLGVREGRTWITRLGVLPRGRRAGTGAVLMTALLNQTRALGCPASILEVIQGNDPAHRLFLRSGFRDMRGLAVLRRPAGPTGLPLPGRIGWLDSAAALDLLADYPGRLPWTNESETYQNGGGAQAVQVDLGAGGRGWLVYLEEEGGLLSHFVLHTLAGGPENAAGALLTALYDRYPRCETSAENVPLDDPHLPALLRLGFFERFRRTEMRLDL